MDLSEWTLFQDLKRLAPDLPPGDRSDRLGAYARVVAPLNARGLLASVDGSGLPWRLARSEVDFEQHALLTFHFEATVPASGRLRLRDTNYVSSYGTSRLALGVSPGTVVAGYEGPTELAEVAEVPIWAMSDDQEEATRGVEVVYGPSGGGELPAEDPARSGHPTPITEPVPPASDEPGAEADRLTALFFESSGRSTPLLLLAALVLGAAHAIQPGHGKTAVVGVSIQGRRPLGRGLILAGTAAVSHFSVAVALAVGAVVLAPSGFDRIDSAATRGVGLVLGLVGAWRVGASLGGATPGEPGSGRRIGSSRDAILAGLALGAIPCWDAVLLLALAWVAGQPGLGVALLLAFSLGASATLLGVALLAGLFRTAARRLADSPTLERSLGTLGGLLLAGIGAFLFLG
ncbi:nickel/cobalt efflux protein RcnA [Tautonia plasticadhaerens]|uniref:Nickel/cobalt efflux system n=1 Tax=Tautonia plasticadhaerens TaxID=2527974 RepID=A0A518GYL3_9BACT|nr:nickel/cobalt efflux protein RcnA [Tautonia plasticadhaerens]